MASKRPVVLDRAAQVRAVSGLVPHQIVSVMERVPRCTVAELAEHTGIPAGSLYYHVRKMKRAGVLLEHEKRSTGGRQEVVYELAGSEVVFDPEASGPGFVKALCRSVRTRLRFVERAYLRALERRGKRDRSGRHRLSLAQHNARLGAAQRAELFRRIRELEQFVIESDDPRRSDFVNVTIAVVPIERSEQG